MKIVLFLQYAVASATVVIDFFQYLCVKIMKALAKVLVECVSYRNLNVKKSNLKKVLLLGLCFEPPTAKML